METVTQFMNLLAAALSLWAAYLGLILSVARVQRVRTNSRKHSNQTEALKR